MSKSIGEVAKEILAKYNFPTFIKHQEAEGKIFDYMIKSNEFTYVVFKDNTLISMLVSTEEGNAYIYVDENPYRYPFNCIVDFREKFPEAFSEFSESSRIIEREMNKDWKLKQYEKLKNELGL
jgi:hypothetical protein